MKRVFIQNFILISTFGILLSVGSTATASPLTTTFDLKGFAEYSAIGDLDFAGQSWFNGPAIVDTYKPYNLVGFAAYDIKGDLPPRDMNATWNMGVNFTISGTKNNALFFPLTYNHSYSLGEGSLDGLYGDAGKNLINSFLSSNLTSAYDASIGGLFIDGGVSSGTVYFALENPLPTENITSARILFDGAVSLTGTPSPSPVPEPSTVLLFGTGLIGLAGVARRRMNKIE